MVGRAAIRIDNPADSRISAYLGVRDRDLRARGDGLFIVEGKVTLDVLLRRSRYPVDSVLVSETRLQALSGMLDNLPDGVPLYAAPQTVMDEIAGFPIHRGVLACARRLPPEGVGALADAATVLALNRISNHDNVGAAFRNAAALGADLVLRDTESCDPLYRKAIRVSAGTSLWLPHVELPSGADQLAALDAAGFETWALTPDPAAEPLSSCAVPAKVAVLVGAEGPGLDAALIDRARPVRIPMANGVDSLNVATAAAIALAHIASARP